MRLVSTLFDSTKINIASVVDRRSLPRPDPSQIGFEEAEDLRDLVTGKIVHVIRLINRTLDLRSDEWKNSPVVWEMLSFSSDVLHAQNTPLAESLRAALDQTKGELQEGVDAETLMNDLDEVIHQTFARRTTIEKVLHAAVNLDIAATPLLRVDSIHTRVYDDVREQVQRELKTADAVLTDAAAKAICDACGERDVLHDRVPEFELGAADVMRVTGEAAMSSVVGDVYLVRSGNVPELGDHYIVITGGLVQKPHGLRPQDVSFPIHKGQSTPLDDYRLDEPLVLLKLNDAARLRFYDAYQVQQAHRRQ